METVVKRGDADRLYPATRRPGSVLQSCGWRNCCGWRRTTACSAATAGGKPGGHNAAALPAQRPPRTTSSGTEQSPPELLQARPPLLRREAASWNLERTENAALPWKQPIITWHLTDSSYRNIKYRKTVYNFEIVHIFVNFRNNSHFNSMSVSHYYEVSLTISFLTYSHFASMFQLNSLSNLNDWNQLLSSNLEKS